MCLSIKSAPRLRLFEHIILIILLSLSGCMLSPLDGGSVSSKDQTFSASGFINVPDTAVFVWARRPGTETWTPLYTTSGVIATLSTSSGSPDSAGTYWYGWSDTFRLPSNSSSWQKVGNSLTIELQSFFYYQGSPIYLATFNSGGIQCLTANNFAVVKGPYGFLGGYSCSTATSIAKIHLPCGGEGQACCSGHRVATSDECATGLTCVNELCKPIAGDVDCAWGSPDCNSCVDNVVNAFNNIAGYGQHMGFHMGDGHPDVESGGLFGTNYHWQGIQRLQGANNNFLVLTSNQDGEAWGAVVEIASIPSSGYAFGTNKQNNENIAPPETDRIVKAFLVSTSSDHPGGISTLGNLVFVPLSRENRVRVFDLSTPTTPLMTEAIPTVPEGYHFVGVTRLNSGHSLMVLGQCSGGSGCDDQGGLELRYLVSDEVGTWFGDANNRGRTHVYTPDNIGHKNGTSGGWHEIQNLNVINECGTGKIFLLATTEDEDPHESWAYLFETIISYYSLNQVRNVDLDMVGKRRLYCTGDGNGFGCNLHAAGGAYIDPNRRLLIYGSEHYNDGPADTVRMKEFAP